MKQVYVLDSCAIITLFKEEDGSGRVKELLEKSIEQKVDLYLPIIQFGEILYVIELYLGATIKAEVREQIKASRIKIANINEELTEEAAQYKARGGISYQDCFVIAIAKKLNGIILTKDKEFKKFEEIVEVEWLP